jgi:hypothetical protein
VRGVGGLREFAYTIFMAVPKIIAVVLGVSFAIVQIASAQDCSRDNPNAVSGTLTVPAPCKPSKREAPTGRREPKLEPGVIRHGNTTIYYGGSLQGQTTVRGR